MVEGLETGGRCQQARMACLRSRVYSETKHGQVLFPGQCNCKKEAWAESSKKAGISQDLDFTKQTSLKREMGERNQENI